MRRLLTALSTSVILAAVGTPVGATLPTPPEAAAPRRAPAFLFYAGAGDVFEIVSSQMALEHARDPAVRAFATTLIAHHTDLTNTALATATAAGIAPPPPELSPMQKAMIGRLATTRGDFDRTYLMQQISAHRQALALMRGYAASGDTPALRDVARDAVPVVEGHLAEAQRLLANPG